MKSEFKCRMHQSQLAGTRVYRVTLSPHGDENKSWGSRQAPEGTINFSIVDPNAQGHFKLGALYTVDFAEVEAADTTKVESA